MRGDVRDHSLGVGDGLDELSRLGDGGLDLLVQLGDLVRLVVAGGLGLLELLVAPELVLILLLLLVHEAEDHLLHLVVHLSEGS